MMKKKNIAMAMAAVTVASSVAPVMAYNHGGNHDAQLKEYEVLQTNEAKKELITEIEKIIDLKYTMGTGYRGRDVYTITVYYTDSDGIQKSKEVKDIPTLKELLYTEGNTDIKVKVVDHGHLINGVEIIGVEGEIYKHTSELKKLADDFNKLDGKKKAGMSAQYDENNDVVKFSYESPTDISKLAYGGATLVKTFDDIELGSQKLKLSKHGNVMVEFDKSDEPKAFDEFYNMIDESQQELASILSEAIDLSSLAEELTNLNNDIEAYKKVPTPGPKDPVIALLKSAIRNLGEDKDAIGNIKQFLNVSSLDNFDFTNVYDKGINNNYVITKGKQLVGQIEEIEKSIDELTKSLNELIELLEKYKPIFKEGLDLPIEAYEDLISAITKIIPSAADLVIDSSAMVNEYKTNYNVRAAANILIAQTYTNKVVGLATKGANDIPTTTHVITMVDKIVEEVKAEDLYDGLMLTEKGEGLLKSLQAGTVTFANADTAKVELLKDGTYKLSMVFKTIGSNGKVVATQEIIVTDSEKANLDKILSIYKNKEVEANKIVGEERYETAVKISQDSFESADAVVLVGGEAIVDGLSATPFAKAINAPILLTQRNSLNASAEAEIKRLLVNDTTTSNLKNKTVYIVGGEAVVGEEVVQTLKAMGIKVERLAGEDRELTSLAVAEKMQVLHTANPSKYNMHLDKTFVVGGKGEADAMSIAVHAAKEGAPIIVTTANSKLSEHTMEFLDGRNIDIIGGEVVVTKELEAELKVIDKDKKIVRTEGADRFETNANVIDRYYTSGVKTVYVAKDGYVEGNDKLVDALAISAVAARDEEYGFVVLATNDLTDKQEDVIERRAVSAKKMTQVGGGVSRKVVEKVAKILGLGLIK